MVDEGDKRHEGSFMAHAKAFAQILRWYIIVFRIGINPPYIFLGKEVVEIGFCRLERISPMPVSFKKFQQGEKISLSSISPNGAPINSPVDFRQTDTSNSGFDLAIILEISSFDMAVSFR